MEYLVIIEKLRGRYEAHVPDLPGCTASGDTHEEARALVLRVMAQHLEALRDRGDTIPESTTTGEMVHVGDV